MDPEQDPIREGLAALSQFLVADCSVADTLQRVVDLSVTAVAHAEFAGLTMPIDGRPATPVFSDLDAPDIDTAQYESGSGPCLEAYHTGQVIAIDDIASEERWPQFCRAALDHGVKSTLSLPLSAAGEHLGALNLYSTTAGPFTVEEQKTGKAFATQASVVLANAQAYWDARTLAENMKSAMEHRSVIDQAKGILMASMDHPSADDAFRLLIRASQRENRKLRDIAIDVVNRRSTPNDDAEEPEGSAASE